MPEPNVHGLFPTPVLFAKFHRDWTKEEKEFFEETAKSTTQNTGNLTSADRYVLDHDVMKDIREYYQFYLNYYMEKIYVPKYPVETYITQSWMNYTKTGQFHQRILFLLWSNYDETLRTIRELGTTHVHLVRA